MGGGGGSVKTLMRLLGADGGVAEFDSLAQRTMIHWGLFELFSCLTAAKIDGLFFRCDAWPRHGRVIPRLGVQFALLISVVELRTDSSSLTHPGLCYMWRHGSGEVLI